MTIKETLAALAIESDALLAKTADDFTDEDTVRAGEIVKEVTRLKGMQDRLDAASAALKSVRIEVNEPDPSDGGMVGKTIGERFTTSEGYQSFKSAHPHGIANGSPIYVTAEVGKAAVLDTTSAGIASANPQFTDGLVFRPRRTLLDLITTGVTATSYLPYRQLTAFSQGAKVVKETADNAGVGLVGGVKPLSTLTMTPADAKVHTYADGLEVTNQELSDDGAIQAIIDGMLTDNVRGEVERVILNGDATAGIEPNGLLKTSGVQQQAFATSMVVSIRKAKTKLEGVGARVQAVVLNPADDEAWDLLTDADGRFLGAGPFGVSPSTAWAIPRITSAAVPAGQALMGDFSTIHLLVREQLKILAFNQHKDYAQRNLQYIRAEYRAMQLFRAPAHLCVVKLTSE